MGLYKESFEAARKKIMEAREHLMTAAQYLDQCEQEGLANLLREASKPIARLSVVVAEVERLVR